MRPFMAMYTPAGSDWTAPLPTIDPQIVLASARALPFYGREFSYSHRVAVGSLSRLALGAAGVAGIVAGAQFGPTRRMLEKVRRSGDGPSLEARASHWFRVRFSATVWSGMTRMPEPVPVFQKQWC